MGTLIVAEARALRTRVFQGEVVSVSQRLLILEDEAKYRD